MRRTGGLLALTSSAVLFSTIAMAPGAGGLTRPEPHPALPANHTPAAPPPCKPKFKIVSDKQFGGANTSASLFHVAEAGRKHAYAVGAAQATSNGPDASNGLTGLLDEGTGTKWKFDDHPGMSLKGVELIGVAATNNHNVWADGVSFTKKNKFGPVVIHKTASGWHSFNLPGSKPLVLETVMTLSPEDVYVGGVTEANKASVPVVLHYNGHKWHKTIFPSLSGFTATAMTVAGHTPVVAMNETQDGFNKTAQSIIEYVKGGKWKALQFPLVRNLTSLSGSSIHDLWATSADVNADATMIYHHTKQWAGTTLSDNEAVAVSERTADPEGVWFAGQSSDVSAHALVDVVRSSGNVGATMEVPAGTKSALASIDASVPNRVIAVGQDTTAGGTRPLIYQATC